MVRHTARKKRGTGDQKASDMQNHTNWLGLRANGSAAIADKDGGKA